MLPGKSLKPQDLIQIAKRRRWLIALPPLVGLFAALLYASRIPDLYQSDMLIAIVPQRLPDTIVRSTVTLKTEERLDAITVEVMSRTALEAMIREMNLYEKERLEKPMEDVVTLMRSNLEVTLETQRRGPRGPEPPHAFHILFTYGQPDTAAKVTERIGNMFVEKNSRDRNRLARSASGFLEEQLADARLKLEEQERRLETFRERHGNELPTQMQMNLQAIQSVQLQVQALVESIARDRDRKAMLERLYRETLNEPVVVTSTAGAAARGERDTDTTQGSSAVQRLASTRAALAAMELKYRPDHPDVVRAKRLIAELEPQAAAESAAAAERSAAGTPAAVPTGTDPAEAARRESLRQMLAEIESLDRQTVFKEGEEKRLRSEIIEYQRRIEAVPGVESEWVKLSRDYETQQTAYKDLLTKAGNAKLAVDLEDEQIGEQFSVIDSAGVPVRPLPSLRAAINAGGAVLGLLLGVGLALFLELRDSSFRTDDDVIETLGLPVLATVPQVRTAQDVAMARKRFRAMAIAGACSVVAVGYLTWTLRLWKSLL